MALPQLYSRRKRQSEAKEADVYQYEKIPEHLRIQVVQIIGDGLGPYSNSRNFPSSTAPLYDHIVKTMRREIGVHQLSGGYEPDVELFRWLELTNDLDAWIDAVELSLTVIDRIVRESWHSYSSIVRSTPDNVIEEINARFREAGFGFQFNEGEMIRVDSVIIHQEVVLPVLHLLREPRFEAAENEYREAHAAYRNGKLEDSLVGCARALESVLKVIGAKRGWDIKENDAASRLIHAAAESGFLPSFHRTALNHLVGLIESSTPTVRNKMGGHGAGTEPRAVPRHLAAYQLHQTAAVLLFLAEQDELLDS
ncbi:STM4504/CBY_0614 family protein [Kaistia defluvii]|uniref:Abortive infection protein-like C-terminal domain-containing protein n=1 Tax=Kaistia defluvii TaxID=410841 RepID=A0ABV2R4F7_9HYPH